jgi:hypothetical protein
MRRMILVTPSKSEKSDRQSTSSKDTATPSSDAGSVISRGSIGSPFMMPSNSIGKIY